ncbi:SDR family oxidoreductase [Allorhizocola rhizosphaerae]|uniref:SDR family oxidoreductase n=1 Tax=Allorhizocola rhizosphaerae TaxID=1872709 RepID=UPI000E3E2ACC|nr:SDR family oxidoreductase [Allorhizocola rhizosphaerae]
MHIDPARLEVCLDVLKQVEALPHDHPDAVRVRRATASVFKAVKQERRRMAREAVLANDDAVTSATATGAPGRIDDETAGIPLVSRAEGATAGVLQRPRACYICKERYTLVDAFYHQLCPDCAKLNHAKRDARTDLTGKRALLTGGRAKIGMYIALRLLRDGAHTTITTRFPNDAIRRFQAQPDSADWMHRLRIVGIDLRDPAQVIALADDVSGHGPLDILINNACQTVRRSPGAYAALIAGEADQIEGPEVVRFGHYTGESPAIAAIQSMPHPADVTALALRARSTAIDAGGLIPDLDATNSWVQVVDEVDPIELLEVQLCNMTAPFILVSRLRAAMRNAPARRKYVVNVSAMEGQFSRGYKGPGHPHTNMAKAALNMLTRTSSREMFESDGILMTAVDTGWITDERPHPTKMRLAESGFHAPLDLVDGAARVYDPIVRGEAGEDVFGCFLKDYEKSAW